MIMRTKQIRFWDSGLSSVEHPNGAGLLLDQAHFFTVDNHRFAINKKMKWANVLKDSYHVLKQSRSCWTRVIHLCPAEQYLPPSLEDATVVAIYHALYRLYTLKTHYILYSYIYIYIQIKLIMLLLLLVVWSIWRLTCQQRSPQESLYHPTASMGRTFSLLHM